MEDYDIGRQKEVTELYAEIQSVRYMFNDVKMMVDSMIRLLEETVHENDGKLPQHFLDKAKENK